MAKKKKKGNSLEFYGSTELINKIESLGGKVEQAIAKSIKEGAKKPFEEMRSYAEQHKETGDMLNSLEIQEPVIKNGIIKMKVGFNIKKGGLPALFLNYGTPRIAPSFFIDKAFENNVDEIKKLQEQALQNAIKELS